MDKLERHIMTNREAFDDKELPEGHLERFETRLDSLLSENAEARRPRFRRVLAAGVAAAVAAALLIHRPESARGDWFAGVGNDQVEICETYYSNVSDIYEELYADASKANLCLMAEGVVDETSPLIEMLPAELGADERAAILKEYYGELLDALLKIKNIK